MTSSFFWGLLSASSLLIGALLALKFKIRRQVLGLIMAFGVGVLISAVAYELVEQAFSSYTSVANGWPVALGLAGGALVYFIGDVLIERVGRRGKPGDSAEQSGLSILLGTILDGIPESMVIGLTILNGGVVSAAMVVAVFLSNLPEAIAATSGLKASGWNQGRIFGLWIVVVLVSALAALAGFVLFNGANPSTVAFTLAFAGGALLTMVADSMAPAAYRDSGKLAGLVTTFGFGLAFAISILE